MQFQDTQYNPPPPQPQNPFLAQNTGGLNPYTAFPHGLQDPNNVNNVVARNENGLLNSPQTYAQNITEGAQAGAQPIANQANNQSQEQASEGGGGMPGMTAAIGNRAQKNFAVDTGKMNQHAQIQGMETANQNINTAASNAIAMYGAQIGVNNQLNQLQLAQNAARYNTISSLMSGAGSLGGMAAGYKSNNPPPPGEDQTVFNASAPNNSYDAANTNNYGTEGSGGGFGSYVSPGEGMVG